MIKERTLRVDMDDVQSVVIGLHDVLTADDIRIHYDFEWGGWVISRPFVISDWGKWIVTRPFVADLDQCSWQPVEFIKTGIYDNNKGLMEIANGR